MVKRSGAAERKTVRALLVGESNPFVLATMASLLGQSGGGTGEDEGESSDD